MVRIPIVKIYTRQSKLLFSEPELQEVKLNFIDKDKF